MGSADVEQQRWRIRRAIAHTLNDLITMEAEDLVENAVALTDAVMAVLHPDLPTEGDA